MEAAQCHKDHQARWAAAPSLQWAIPGSREASSLTNAKTPCCLVRRTDTTDATAAQPRSALPGVRWPAPAQPSSGNAQKGGVKIRIQGRAQVRTRRSQGQAFGPLFRPRQRSPGRRSSAAAAAAPSARLRSTGRADSQPRLGGAPGPARRGSAPRGPRRAAPARTL